MGDERRELTMAGQAMAAAPRESVPLPSVSWPPPRADWMTGQVLAVVDGLTRTRLAQAAKAIAARRGESADAALALYERTNAALATGLASAEVGPLKADLAMQGVQARSYDVATLLPCPPARVVDEIRWDAAGLRLRTTLGVHATPWRDLSLGLLAMLRDPAGGAHVPILDLVTQHWERFRVSGPLAPPARGAKDDGAPSLPRLAAAVLDKAPGLPCNEALTTLSIHQEPKGPVFGAILDHEAWATLWLAHARRSHGR